MQKSIPLYVWIGLLILTATSCQEPSQPYQGDDSKLFTKIPAEHSGITFANRLPVDDPKQNILNFDYYYNGGGVAIGDINGDKLPDVFFSANIGPNRLYLNKGNLQFEDITEKAGVSGIGVWRNGCTMADVNADGLLDIYVSVGGRTMDAEKRKNILYINNGDLTFTNQAEAFGLDDIGYSTHAAFYDYDNDGDLDCFVMNHHVFDVRRRREQMKDKGEALSRDLYVGDHLLENNGGKFTDVTEKSNLISNALGYGLGLGLGDLTNDGYTDIYVSNDYIERDYLYYFQPNIKSYQEVLKNTVNHISKFSMGNDIGDLNNDGLMDIITLDMAPEDNFRQKVNMSAMNPDLFWMTVSQGMHYQYMFNMVQLNNGNGTFSDIAQMAGLAYSDWSWAALLADYDQDGHRDLFVTNGYRKEALDKDFSRRTEGITKQINQTPEGPERDKMIVDFVNQIPEAHLPNYAFKNQGNLTFNNVGEAWGLKEHSYSSGAAYADLDNDGDLDLVINNIDEEAWLYRNNAAQKNETHYLKIALKGEGGNTHGLGARVILDLGDMQLTKDHHTVHGYLSSVDQLMHFGLGNNAQVQKITVIWPGGKFEEIENVAADQTLTLSQANASGKFDYRSLYPSKQMFSNVTRLAGLHLYKHEENTDFDDYDREVLLPHRMSQWGPGVAVGDLDGNGLEDIFLGGAKGQPGAIYMQQQNGTFLLASTPALERDGMHEDLGAELFDVDGDGDLDLYVVSGGNEADTLSGLYQDRLYLNQSGQFMSATHILPKINASGGRARAADFDGDGDMDLVVMGRQVPGRYPHPANSYLLRNDNGKLTDATEELAPQLRQLGMATDATWADLNSDQQLDLVIVGEWMPVKIFFQEDGKFTDATAEAEMGKTNGWWFSIEAKDIDQDGDLDLICGNNGLNYKYQASLKEPFQVFSKDFDDNGSNDIVLSYYNDGKCFPVRGRQCSSEQIPDIKKKFETYKAFGMATVDKVYGEDNLEKSLNLKAYTFASTIFLNDGAGHFQAKPLPNEAQISSISGIVCEDFNQDGHLDLAVAGNLYHAEIETTRNDASIGLIMLGDGKGNFEPVALPASGFFAAGDVKDLRLVRMVEGQTCLLVVRNNSAVSLFHLQSPNAL